MKNKNKLPDFKYTPDPPEKMYDKSISRSIPETNIFTQEQFNYVMSVEDIYLRSHLLHQVRLRDNMEKDRNEFEKICNELQAKYSELLKNVINETVFRFIKKYH